MFVGLLVFRPGAEPSPTSASSPEVSATPNEGEPSGRSELSADAHEITEPAMAVPDQTAAEFAADSSGIATRRTMASASADGLGDVPQPSAENSPPEPVPAATDSPPAPTETPVEPLPEDLANIPAPEKRPTSRVSQETEIDLPPIPDEILPIKADRFGAIKKNISLERRARDAFALFEVFSKSFEFDDNQRQQVEKELAAWKQRAEQDLYRLGTKWVSKNAVEEAAVKGESILQQADEALAKRQYAEAVKLYEEASRVDPNNVRADYTLGLMYSLPFAGDYQVDKSLNHFTKVDTKSPNFAAAHNSLGITYAKQGKFTNAISHFENAADLQMYCPEVIQNLGRMRHLAELLRVDSRSLARCQELYDKLIAEEKGEPFRADVGWLHMMPVFSSEERGVDLNQAAGARNLNAPQDSQSDLTPANYATAFLVAPEYLLTVRHAVVSETFGVAEQVGVRDSRGRELFGIVVGLAKQDDLALIHIPGLRGIPLSLAASTVPQGTPLTAFVAPHAVQQNTGRPGSVQQVQGAVSSLPDETRPGIQGYGLSHTAGPTAFGSPALNAQGEVAALLTRQVSQFDTSFGGSLQGVTSVAARKFLEEHLGAIQDSPGIAPAGNAAAIQGAIPKAVFPLTTYYRSSMQSLSQAADSTGDDRQTPYEDYTCPVCNGLALLPCTARGCVGGSISESYFVTVNVPVLDKTIQRQEKRFRKVDCNNCDGGKVDCPHCISGYDSSLRRGQQGGLGGKSLRGR